MPQEIFWNSVHEKLLKKWSENAKFYSLLHTLASEYFNKWNKRLGVPTVVLGGVTASSIFGTTSADVPSWVPYANGALVLVITALTGVTGFLGLQDKATGHDEASYRYTRIAMIIDTVLSFPRAEREEKPRDFLIEMRKDLLEIRKQSYRVPSWIIADYVRNLDEKITNVTTKVNTKDPVARGIGGFFGNCMGSQELDDSYSNSGNPTEFADEPVSNSADNTPPVVNDIENAIPETHQAAFTTAASPPLALDRNTSDQGNIADLPDNMIDEDAVNMLCEIHGGDVTTDEE